MNRKKVVHLILKYWNWIVRCTMNVYVSQTFSIVRITVFSICLMRWIISFRHVSENMEKHRIQRTLSIFSFFSNLIVSLSSVQCNNMEQDHYVSFSLLNYYYLWQFNGWKKQQNFDQFVIFHGVEFLKNYIIILNRSNLS